MQEATADLGNIAMDVLQGFIEDAAT